MTYKLGPPQGCEVCLVPAWRARWHVHTRPHLLDRYGRDLATGAGVLDHWACTHVNPKPPLATRKRLLRGAGFVLPPTSTILGDVHAGTRSKMSADEKAIVKRYAPHLLHYIEKGEDAFEFHPLGDSQVHTFGEGRAYEEIGNTLHDALYPNIDVEVSPWSWARGIRRAAAKSWERYGWHTTSTFEWPSVRFTDFD